MRDRFSAETFNSVPELEASDFHKLEAAEGYHMIGMYQAAAEEITSISMEQQSHPKVLHVACRVYWALRRIPESMAAAERFIKVQPEHPFGHILKPCC